MRFPINTRVLYTFMSAGIVILGSFVAIRMAKGDRGIQFNGTGLLVANSFPSGAELYLNGKLTSATDDTLYLEPGDYQVEIKKDGYTSWQKGLKVERELVTQTNAQLFRLVPGLTPLTFVGVQNVTPSPDGQKLLYYTASASAQVKKGLYVLELNGNLISSTREPRQISDDSGEFDLATANFIWSPDNTEVLLTGNGREVLLDLNKKNIISTLPDVSTQKRRILAEWESQMYLRERQYLSKFPTEVLAVATQSAKNVYLSPDKKKILYTATAAATLPENLSPPLLASNSQPEARTLEPGKTYVYDREEDKNFLLDVPVTAETASDSGRLVLASDLARSEPVSFTASPSAFQRLQATASGQTVQNFKKYYSSLYTTGIQWFPDSRHFLFSQDDKIYLIEYDNTNKTTVYSGPFTDNFIYPWPDGSKLLIMTSFSANSPQNLYAIELK